MDKFCFIHIEKAGGSTIHNWLKYYIPNYLSLKPWYYWSNEKGNELTQKELMVLKFFHPKLKGIGGHTTRHYLEYCSVFGEEVFYFTFLREPISRYLSHFMYQKNDMGIDWSLNDFVNEDRFNNYMCVRICGKESADKAFNELRDKYGFVGLVEKFDESLMILNKKLSITKYPYYEKRNEAKGVYKVDFKNLDEKLKNKILLNNKHDILLYEKFCKELYPKYLNCVKKKEVSDFTANNKEYNYSRGRFFLIKLFKGYNRFFSEPISHYLK